MAVIGKTNKTYISSITFMDQRDILEEALDVTGEDASVLDIMEITGRFKVTDVPTYDHFENTYRYKSATISAIDATLNGDTNEILEMTITSDQYNGEEQSLPVVNELAMFQNKQIGLVTSVNKATRVVQVTPLSANAADALNPAGTPTTTGETVIFFSNASSEGSDDPEGRKPKWNRSQNRIQIFKTANEITDLQKVSKIEVNYKGQPHVMYKLQHDTLMKHRSDIAHGLLVGKQATITDPNTSSPVHFTQGLRRYILGGDGLVNTSGGVDLPLASAVTQANFRTISRALDKRGAPKEFWLWAGGDLRADLDEVLLAIPGIDVGVVYNSWGSADGKKRALDYGVNSVKLYGRTFHIKDLIAYDNPEVFGATNFDFAAEGYLIPTGKIKSDAGGSMSERLCVRYMSGDGTDLKHLETVTGKLAPIPTDTTAVLKFGYQSVMGLQALGIRQFGIFSKAAA